MGYELGRVGFGGRVGKISVTHNRLLGFIFQTFIDIAIVFNLTSLIPTVLHVEPISLLIGP